MKTLIIIFSVFFIFGSSFAYEVIETKETKTSSPDKFCPATMISDNDKCMNCHAMRNDKDGKQYFGLKEIKVDANFNEKPGAIDNIYREKDTVTGLGGHWAAYMLISGVSPSYFRKAADYLYWHPEIKKLVIELHTGGGSIMAAWRAVGIIKEMQARGIIVEMRVNGLSASAGVILLVAGDLGHRFVNSHAEIMLHKIWTFKMFALDTPDTAEDAAATLKHFQENINNFILSRSKMTKKELDECIFKKDFWMTGARAVELGLADGFIGD